MRISIITAVYNRERTIGEAIESVTRQTYGDVEHLIIDGASSDGTLNEVHRHKHPGLRVESKRDHGIYDALNKGMALASGEVFGLAHSDDYLADATVLARVAKAFADPTIDAVYGNLDYVAAEDTSRVIRHWQAGEFSAKKLALGWMPPHPSLFVRRRVVDTFGGYDINYRISADYDAVLRWFGRGAIRSRYLPRVLAKMRVGGESNRSVGRIMRKSCEDYRALRTNGIGGLGSLAWKNLSKISQFIVR